MYSISSTTMLHFFPPLNTTKLLIQFCHFNSYKICFPPTLWPHPELKLFQLQAIKQYRHSDHSFNRYLFYMPNSTNTK